MIHRSRVICSTVGITQSINSSPKKVTSSGYAQSSICSDTMVTNSQNSSCPKSTANIPKPSLSSTTDAVIPSSDDELSG